MKSLRSAPARVSGPGRSVAVVAAVTDTGLFAAAATWAGRDTVAAATDTTWAGGDPVTAQGVTTDDRWDLVPPRTMPSASRARPRTEAARPGARGMHTQIDCDAESVLTRDYIWKALYDPDEGYFTQHKVVHSPPDPIQFGSLLGQWEYRAKLAELYAQTPEAWLTPCEVFAPWYSFAIANYIIRSRGVSDEQALTIIEVGGGSGANAAHILHYIKTNAPEVYGKMRYGIIEISESLAERQRQRLAEHSSVFSSIHADATSWDGTGISMIQADGPCFVVALEVLDNLPHDKVVWLPSVPSDAGQARASASTAVSPISTSTSGHAWHQTRVHKHNDHVAEVYEPATDDLIVDTLRAVDPPPYHKLPDEPYWRSLLRQLGGGPPKADELVPIKGPPAHFIPTGAFSLIRNLANHIPDARLILADFETLPPVEEHLQASPAVDVLHHTTAYNSPIVATKQRGDTTSYGNYLSPPYGCADIFFPTDFDRLATMCRSLGMHHPRTVSSTEFLRSYADTKQTLTMSGYNPLLEDYTNTRFLLS